MITNKQAYVASTQTSPKFIDNIVEDTLVPIKLLKTKINYHMVIIQAEGSIQQLSKLNPNPIHIYVPSFPSSIKAILLFR